MRWKETIFCFLPPDFEFLRPSPENNWRDPRHFQEIVGQCHEFYVNLFQATQWKATERPIALDVTKNALDLNFSSSVDFCVYLTFKGFFRYCFHFFKYRIPMNLSIAFRFRTLCLQWTIETIFTFVNLAYILKNFSCLVCLKLPLHWSWPAAGEEYHTSAIPSLRRAPVPRFNSREMVDLWHWLLFISFVAFHFTMSVYFFFI